MRYRQGTTARHHPWSTVRSHRTTNRCKAMNACGSREGGAFGGSYHLALEEL